MEPAPKKLERYAQWFRRKITLKFGHASHTMGRHDVKTMFSQKYMDKIGEFFQEFKTACWAMILTCNICSKLYT